MYALTYKQCLQSVDKGWWFLIRILWRNKPEGVDIVQVKEKFAGLRVYTEPFDPAYQITINTLSTISFRTCEKCGDKGTPHTYNHWVKTLCPKCQNKREGKDRV